MNVIPLFVAVLLVAACSPSSPPPSAPARDDAHARLQTEMEQATMDFSKVTVVRLQRDGKRLEVANVTPTVVASANVSGEPVKTIFRINDRIDSLVLFSRDIANAKSIKTEITFTRLTENSKFAFPVVQADGSLKEEQFSVMQIVQPPPPLPGKP